MKALKYRAQIHTVYIRVCVYVCVCVWSHIPQNTTRHNSAWATFCHLVYMYRVTALLILWCSNLYLFISFLTLGVMFFFFFSVYSIFDHEYHVHYHYHAVLWSFSRLSLKFSPSCLSVPRPIPKCYDTLPLVMVLKLTRGGCRVVWEWQCYISVYLSTRLLCVALFTSHRI